MTQREEIGHLRGLLQHRNRWYIDVQSPDIEEMQEIGEKAKEYADNKLSTISTQGLYIKYQKWVKSDKILSPEADYYHSFLNDLAWELGLSALKGQEREWYTESINLKIYFI
jgi:hypothetical protein